MTSLIPIVKSLLSLLLIQHTHKPHNSLFFLYNKTGDAGVLCITFFSYGNDIKQENNEVLRKLSDKFDEEL